MVLLMGMNDITQHRPEFFLVTMFGRIWKSMDTTSDTLLKLRNCRPMKSDTFPPMMQVLASVINFLSAGSFTFSLAFTLISDLNEARHFLIVGLIPSQPLS